MLVAVPGSDWFATANSDGTVRLCDPDRPKAPQKTLGSAGGSPIAAVEVSNDGANLVSVSENDEVKVWRLSDGVPIWGFQGAPSSHSGVAFSRDDSLVADRRCGRHDPCVALGRRAQARRATPAW